ncbi:MAG: AI-2E family transporter [Microthrixaceae bacterium]
MASVGEPNASGEAPVREQPVSPRLRWLSEVVWRTAILIGAFLVVGWVLWELKIVMLPVFVALLLSTALTWPVVALEKRGWPSGLATAAVFFGFLLALAGLLAAIVPPTVDGLSGLDNATQSALDDVENWLVDGPLGLQRSEVQQYTSDPAGSGHRPDPAVLGCRCPWARMVGETLVGALLSLVLVLLFLKDASALPAPGPVQPPRQARDGGPKGSRARLGDLRRLPARCRNPRNRRGDRDRPHHVDRRRAPGASDRCDHLRRGVLPDRGRHRRGCARSARCHAGIGRSGAWAVVVGVVVLVQQLDSDLLGPVIYGHALDIHPAVVLLVLTAGGALGGSPGPSWPFHSPPRWRGGQELWNARSLVDEMGPDVEASEGDRGGG